MTLANANTYKKYERKPQTESSFETNALGQGSRKRAQDVHSWSQPFYHSLITIASVIEFLNLVLKDGDDSTSRVA